MERIKYLWLAVFFISSLALCAQERSWDPSQMAQREMKIIMDSIPDLSDDQKLVIEEIYNTYSSDLTAIMEEANGDREKMRNSFIALRDEKNELLREILTDDQWSVYERLTARNRRRRPQNN